MANKPDLSYLMEFCLDAKEESVISCCISEPSLVAGFEKAGVQERYGRRVIAELRKRAATAGKAPAAGPDYSLLTDLIKPDHEYTEDELIRIVRELKLADPSKFITRTYFRTFTKIPDRAWTHIFGTFEEFVRQAKFSLSRHQHKMEKQVAAHKSRDHYEYANERHGWGAEYLNKNKGRVLVNVVFSDTHDKLIDPFFKRVLVDSCRRIKPDRVIMNGDLFDLAEFGRFTIDPRDWDVVGRIKVVHELIADLRDACPDAEFWFLEGNHEFRLLKHLMDNTPAMRAVLADLHGWDTKTLLGLEEFEINYVSKADLKASKVGEINKEVQKSYKIFDDCYAVGHYKMLNLGMDGINGHDHKFQAWPVRRIKGGAATWIQNGCGHVIDADYCNAEQIWNQGFTVTSIDTLHKSVNQNYIPITNIAEVGGEFYYREEGEMVGAFVKEAA